MTGLGGSVGDALQLHQDLAEGSAGHLLHLDVESLASPVSGKEKLCRRSKKKKVVLFLPVVFLFYLPQDGRDEK